MAHNPDVSRRRRPWWIWMLASCAGCSVVLLGAAAVLVYVGYGFVRDVTDVGPITTESVRQSLGSDVPLYPNSTVDTAATRVTLTGLRVMEKAAQGSGGSPIRGVAALRTTAAPDQVMAFYEKQLRQSGWKRTSDLSSRGMLQRLYEKDSDQLMVQVDRSTDGGPATTIFLSRSNFGALPQGKQPGAPGK